MTDHPLLGAALFAIGAVLVGDAYYSSDAQSFILGHIAAFNGVLLVALGCSKLERHAINANRTFRTYCKQSAR